MMLRIIVQGGLCGLAVLGGLALWDAAYQMPGNLYGLQTLLTGVAGGGLMLILGLAMSATSYFLASRNKAAAWRKRLLTAAIFCGGAGLVCGFGAAAFWVAMGSPWFP